MTISFNKELSEQNNIFGCFVVNYEYIRKKCNFVSDKTVFLIYVIIIKMPGWHF